MPQVDLETLVSACAGGGTDRKIACETLATEAADAGDKKNGSGDQEADSGEIETVVAPESFWLSKDSEFDWFDRNAFYERKESTRGVNPNAAETHLNSNPSSQRFSKASIFRLPKSQKTTYAESSKRRTATLPAKIRLFPPRRTGSIGKPGGEPSSPKVSCIGRVRSKHLRRRSSTKREKPVRSNGENRKPRFYSRIVSIFRPHSNHKPAKTGEKKPQSGGNGGQVGPVAKSVKAKKSREIPRSAEPVIEEPGLKRFASGRRSESWGASVIQ
ncbi:hypothetical protein DM860_003355 [Cuscuta australis]|uniref:Uncharacterized protein n=1 Tax=Cuscuta australis TaxID=267555 RepID=A0A328DGG2_9ASTE|nr:hypothetical protein DM860_003355 [Cuscuta australis]